jgi:hypothetical protein
LGVVNRVHPSNGSGIIFGTATAQTQGLETTDSVQFARITADNLALDGNTLSATGNLVLAPTGYTDAGAKRITNLAEPVAGSDAATKQYVDDAAEGLKSRPQVRAATTGNLAATYNNGTSGVGATLTATTNGAFPLIDGVQLTTVNGSAGLLVRAQTAALQNGRYNLTNAGSASTPWVLTRCGLCNQASEIPGSYTFVQAGTLYANTGWVQTVVNPTTFTVGTDAIMVVQFSGAGTYTAGTGLNLSGTQFLLANTTVTAGTYGSSTQIPQITVNAQGQVTGASNNSITVGAGDLTINSSGTGLTGSGTFNANSSSNQTITISSNATSANTASTIVARDSSGNFTAGTITAALTGNASTATALATARTIGMTGDVSWTSAAFNGSGNVTGTATLANTSVNPGTYGSGTQIPSITVDGKGRVTAVSNNSITVGNGQLTLATGGIATGSQTFTANQASDSTFTVTVPGTNIAEGTRTTTGVPLTSSTGTGTTLSAATTSLAGVMSSADKTKLDGIASSATANTGTVTSVATSGTVSGLTLTGGTITTSGIITLGGTLSASISNISDATRWWNNFGDNHSTRASFDATAPSYGFGWRYVQGTGNGPNTGGTQYYSMYTGLGNDYPATGAGSYGMYIAIDRNSTTPYLSVRYNESNSLSTWKRINAGGADAWTTARTLTVGNTGKSVNGSANVSWTLVEIGALALTGGTLTGPLEISTGATSGNYNEGLRLTAANNGWAGVTFGSTGLSGTPTSGWFAARNPTNQFIISPGTSDNTVGLQLNSGGNALWRNSILLTASNYNSYSPNLTGGGASGTWNINITGNAATATNAVTATNAQNATFTTLGNANWGGKVQLGGNGSASALATVAVVQATDGNLHMDPGSGKSTYLNYYNNGVIYLNGTTYSISSNGSNYNGNSATATHAGNADNADTVDNIHASGFTRNFGGVTINPAGYNTNCTTAQFISWLTSLGAFNFTSSVMKCTWDYAGNNDISDTGFGQLELAGCVVETFIAGSEYIVRVTSPSTGTGAGGIHEYVNHGSGYSPGWRRVYTSALNGNISGNAATATSATSATTATNVDGGYARLSNIRGTDQMIENSYGAYLHIGDWGVGRTANTAVLVNTAYMADTLSTARNINGIPFNGSANIDTTEWFHSDRDFPNGTLITTNINYADSSGDPFVLEIRGNSYGGIVPLDLMYQGYIYSDTIINHGGISNGLSISGLVAINNGGNLCFWFPNQGYWNGYNVKVYSAYATRAVNRVTSITGVAKPTTAKQVELSSQIRQSLHSSNYNSYSPTLTGGNASGTWGISVTGNAATITNQANSATITASTGVTGSHIVQRDGNGYIYANHINFNTSEGENATINSFITSNGDGWSRKASLAHVKNSIRGVADGTWGINITGNAGSANTATTATNVSGGTANVTTLTVNSNNISAVNSLGFRNRIINGDMEINQRGAGAVLVTSASIGVKTVDRWFCAISGAGGVTFQQVVDGPTNGPKYSLKMTTTTAWTGTGQEGNHIFQWIENSNVLDFKYGTAQANSCVVSFWVKSSLTGSFSAFLYTQGGTANAARSIVTPFTISAANTWEFKTITFVGDVTGAGYASIADNGPGLLFGIDLGSGTGRNTSTTNTWQEVDDVRTSSTPGILPTSGATMNLTGVQLEAGIVATPFERVDYGRKLFMCQRYYFNKYFSIFIAAPAATSVAMLDYPAYMRAAPTTIGTAGYTSNVSYFTLDGQGTTNTRVVMGSTAGGAGEWTGFISAESEL